MADYRFVVEWAYTGDDRRQIGLALTGAEALDEGIVETAFDGLWDELRGYYDPFTVLAGYKWYEGVAGTPGNPQWGDSFRVTARDLPGTDTNAAAKNLPPQVAVVISFPMPMNLRRHRGRVYMPAPSSTHLADDGRFASWTFFAAAWRDFLNEVRAAGWQPSVLAYVGGLPSFLEIDKVRVDNVFDTQRRRGHELATQSTEYVLT